MMSSAASSQSPPPLWTWCLLCFSILGVSSAGTLFQQVDEIPPLLRASWRLQATSVVLFPPALWQWIAADHALKTRCFQVRSLAIMAVSGFAVAVHFGSWVVSLDLTTLAHALLFVSCHPLVIVVGMYFMHNLPIRVLARLKSYGLERVRAPNAFEYAGVLSGFVGAGLTLLDVGSAQDDHTVTVLGDAIAFLGALTFIVYATCGRILREWMPLFVYAFPVTFVGSLILLGVSFLWEANAADFGPFGWATTVYIWWFVALALAAGVLGHTGFTACLSFMSPLIVCSSIMLEPIFGSALGYILFGASLPGVWTIVGGVILVCGFLATTYGTINDEDADATPKAPPDEESENAIESGIEMVKSDDDGEIRIYSAVDRDSEKM